MVIVVVVLVEVVKGALARGSRGYSHNAASTSINLAKEGLLARCRCRRSDSSLISRPPDAGCWEQKAEPSRAEFAMPQLQLVSTTDRTNQ